MRGAARFGPWTDPFSLIYLLLRRSSKQWTKYTADLIRLVEIRGLHPHLFADDKQIYVSCRPEETQDSHGPYECMYQRRRRVDAV